MEQLKILLGINSQDMSKDTILELVLNECRDYILSYCHLQEIPLKLRSLVPFMAADMYRAKGYGAKALPADVKSVSEGQRTVSFDVKRLTTGEIFEAYHKRLNPYRKARTPSEITDDMEA